MTSLRMRDLPLLFLSLLSWQNFCYSNKVIAKQQNLTNNVSENFGHFHSKEILKLCIWLLVEIIFLNNSSVKNMFLKKCVFSVSSSNTFLIYDKRDATYEKTSSSRILSNTRILSVS